MPKAASPLIFEKSGQGGAQAITTNVSEGHCSVRQGVALQHDARMPWRTTLLHSGSTSQDQDTIGSICKSTRDWWALPIPSKNDSKATLLLKLWGFLVVALSLVWSVWLLGVSAT